MPNHPQVISPLCSLLLVLLCAPAPTAPAQTTANRPDPRSLTNGEPNEYRLHTGDTIEIKVYEEDDLNTKQKLDDKGEVSLPLLAPIKLQGLTTTEAKEAVRKGYSQDYLKNPVISVSVTDYGRSKISVLGQVKSPGVYTYASNEDLNALQAIAMAGGYTRYGQPRKIVIKRVTDAQEHIIRLDGEAMAEKQNTKLQQILPGDIITVGETTF